MPHKWTPNCCAPFYSTFFLTIFFDQMTNQQQKNSFKFSGCTWWICGTCETAWSYCENRSGLFEMDSVRARKTSANNVILAPGEQLRATIVPSDALIGHSSEHQQQLHQFLRKCFSSTAAAPPPLPSSSSSSSSSAAAVVAAIKSHRFYVKRLVESGVRRRNRNANFR